MMPIRLSTAFVTAVLGIALWFPISTVAQSSGSYSENCVSNVKNATIHVPSENAPTLPSGTPIQEGDTLAVYTEDGTCAGFGVWTDTGVLLAAAGGLPAFSDSLEYIPNGLEKGEELKFEVFDASAGTAVTLASNVQYASCENVDAPDCRDDGRYAANTFHRVAEFNAAADKALPSNGSDEYALGKSTPNPVHTKASFQYRLPEKADVTIHLFDVLGRRVTTVVNGPRESGLHSAKLETDDLTSGVYFLRMRANSYRETQRISVVR